MKINAIQMHASKPNPAGILVGLGANINLHRHATAKFLTCMTQSGQFKAEINLNLACPDFIYFSIVLSFKSN